MKKSVVLTIGAIYVVAFVVVAVIGVNIGGIDPKVPVTDIVVSDPDNGALGLKQLNPKLYDVPEDYYFMINFPAEEKEVRFRLEAIASPNKSYPIVNYVYDKSKSDLFTVKIEDERTGIAEITVKEPYAFNLYPTSTDGNKFQKSVCILVK